MLRVFPGKKPRLALKNSFKAGKGGRKGLLIVKNDLSYITSMRINNAALWVVKNSLQIIIAWLWNEKLFLDKALQGLS